MFFNLALSLKAQCPAGRSAVNLSLDDGRFPLAICERGVPPIGISITHSKQSSNSLECLEQFNQNTFIDLEISCREIIASKMESVDDGIHLFSHGRSGELLINGKWLQKEAILEFVQKQFSRIGEERHLNIYGCEFGKGQKGIEAVGYLQRELGISVSASDDITGFGGDWDLEEGNSQSAIAIENYPLSLQATCPVMTPTVYDKSLDIIITTYHSHIARGEGVFFTWGEDMSANASNATVMTPIYYSQ